MKSVIASVKSILDVATFTSNRPSERKFVLSKKYVQQQVAVWWKYLRVWEIHFHASSFPALFKCREKICAWVFSMHFDVYMATLFNFITSILNWKTTGLFAFVQCQSIDLLFSVICLLIINSRCFFISSNIYICGGT